MSFLDPTKSPRELITSIAHGARITKELQQGIINHNGQHRSDKFNFFACSTIALPILGFVFNRHVNTPVAIVTASMAFFTALVAKYQYDCDQTSLGTLQLYRNQNEALLEGVIEYLNTKRSHKEDVLIKIFNGNSYNFSYIFSAYDTKLKEAKNFVAKTSYEYDNNNLNLDAAQLVQSQEFRDILPFVKIIFNIDKPSEVSQYTWDKLKISCRYFLGISNHPDYSYVYLGSSYDNRCIIAKKERV